jgi:hypothetical protein
MNYNVGTYSAPYNFSNQAYFYVQGMGGPIGTFVKSMQAKSLITLDYSSVVTSGVSIQNFSFVLTTQTLPPLIISQPILAGQNNIIEFKLSNGFGGVQYDITVNAQLINSLGVSQGMRVDVFTVNIIPPYEADCGCGACGCSPCRCYEVDYCCDTITDLKNQVATLATNNSIFGTNFVQYYVSNTAPSSANLFDKWFNPTTGVISDYISDGVSSYWRPEFSAAGGTVTGPVTFDSDVTIDGVLDATLDMGSYG